MYSDRHWQAAALYNLSKKKTVSIPCQYLTSMHIAIKGQVSSKSVRGGNASLAKTY